MGGGEAEDAPAEVDGVDLGMASALLLDVG